MSKTEYIKKFKFTVSKLLTLPSNDKNSKSIDLEFSDTEVIGLKCLSGLNAYRVKMVENDFCFVIVIKDERAVSLLVTFLMLI
jgi:hypothetical protein